MIQLSDTKAAPGLGVLLGAKPKAGGDASAFALALGSLVTDGQPGTLIALPRQIAAATGSYLPDVEMGDVEGEDAIDSALPAFSLCGLIDPMIVPPVTPSPSPAPSMAAAPVADEPEDRRGATVKMPVVDITSGAPARHPVTIATDVPTRSARSGPDMDKPVVVAETARPPIAPSLLASTVITPSRPISNITKLEATTAQESRPKAASTAVRLPVDQPLSEKAAFGQAPVEERPTAAVTIAQMPVADRPLEVIALSQMPAGEPGAPSFPASHKPAAQPKTMASQPPSMAVGKPPNTPISESQTVSPVSRIAQPIPGPAIATTPAERATAPAQTVQSLAAAPPLEKPMVPEVAAATPPAGTPLRAAVTARFESPPVSPKPRVTAPTAKATTETASPTSIAVPTLPTKVEAATPVPTKFATAEVMIEAPSTAIAPRRVAITPFVPSAASTPATALTVADLIPPAHRQRTGVASLAPVVDAASAGLSAPIEAASHIAEPAPIDTQATDWIEGMIEQIDVMRDARADGTAATTTRIRLTPDALGAIEIVLSGEGDAIDVRINAETAAARTLLAEAAPRLADMAEARGLKLAQGDAGQPGQHQAQRQQNQDQPTANRGRTTDTATTGGNPDERIA